MDDDFLDLVSHRPFPLPRGRWLWRQRWDSVLLLHFRVAPAAIGRVARPHAVAARLPGCSARLASGAKSTDSRSRSRRSLVSQPSRRRGLRLGQRARSRAPEASRYLLDRALLPLRRDPLRGGAFERASSTLAPGRTSRAVATQ